MTTRGSTGRGIVLLAMVTGLLAATTTAAEADHGIVERVSFGPNGGNGDDSAFIDDVTPDGQFVMFETTESLVAADDDGGLPDLYVRGGGLTRLATPGLPGLVVSAHPSTISDDGSRVFFNTHDPLVPEDTDTRGDVYMSQGDQEFLLSPGTGDDVLDDASFQAVSSDGTRVVFTSWEPLTDDDTDDAGDQYLWHDGTVTRLSVGPAGGNGPNPASFDAMSEDGSVLVFETSEQLVAADTDNAYDVYRRAGSQTTLVSNGTTGGVEDSSVQYILTSRDGGRILFDTTEQLTASDTDTTNDVYLWADGVTTLLSAGSADTDAFFTDANRDLTAIGLSTDEALLPQDVDSEEDVYAWRDGTLLLLTTAPGHQSNLDTRFISDDGKRVVLTAFTPLTPGETNDHADDLYLWDNGQTTLLSPGTSDDDARFWAASVDGSRVFFDTQEALLPSDTDLARDNYEVSGSGLSKVTPGNADFPAGVPRISSDGSRVYWTTEEQVTADDTDAATDVYLARIAAPKNLTPPTISGTAGAGRTLTCNPGTWSNAESFAFRWNRDGTPIPGATAPTYVVPAGDAGHALTCTVTATGDGGSTSATSAAVTVALPTPTGALPGPCANAAVGTSGADLLRGTTFGDILYGLAGPDRLRGLEGTDCLVGGPGRDRLTGGHGLDKLEGGKAGDRLSGGPGRDRVRGGAGADLLSGGGARDRLIAGPGDDTLRARDAKADSVRCGDGHDVAVVDKQDRVSGCEVVRLG